MIAADDPRHGTVAFLAVGRDERGRRVRCDCQPCRTYRMRYEKRRRLLLERGERYTVPNIGFRRRLQALYAIGYPRRLIAVELGISPRHLSQKLVIGARVRPATLARLVEVYDRLSMTPGPSSTSRARAAGKGWYPPLAWDDNTIDDPAAEPYRPRPRKRHQHEPLGSDQVEVLKVDQVVVERALAGQTVTANPAERAEVVRQWTRAGGSLRQLDVVQGWNTARDIRIRQQQPALTREVA